MLSTFLIALREGLEAALIIGILVAYLVKIDQRRDIPKVLSGAGVAVILSIAIGLLLTSMAETVPAGTEEIIAGLTSILAVAFVTWMVFWMARQSHRLGAELRSQVDKARAASTWSLVGVAFLAVIREGIETSVFIWSASRGTGEDTYPVIGASAGLLAAAVLGYLIYRGSLKLNLGTFFKYTGAYLIVLAAGTLAYGVHELQEIGWFPVLESYAYDVSGALPKGSVAETLLRGILVFRTTPSWLEVLTWVIYAAVVGYIFAGHYRKRTNV